MNRFLKICIFTLIALLLFVVLFFLWASSPTLSEDDYASIITNNYEQKIDNDSIYGIVTYNIGYLSGMTNNTSAEKPRSLFEENLKKAKDNFLQVNPDIIAFQEIDYDAARSYFVNQQNEIASLGYNYVAKAVNWDETYVPFPYWPLSIHFGKTVSGQSILSKYPIISHERKVLERVANAPFYRDALYLERLAQISSIRLEQKEIKIINVHLEAFDKPTRVKQMDAIIRLFEAYSKAHPTILLGDFNSAPTFKNPAIEKLLSLPNVGNAVFNEEAPSNTYDTEAPFKRIDYIFYSKNSIAYVDGKVLTQFGQTSDHLPVLMRFKLK